MGAAKRLLHVDGLAPSVPYSYAAVAPEGARLVFLAGACPLDPDGRTLAVGDVVGQARACSENMRAALDACGARPADVVFLRVLVASAARSDLAAAWDAAREAFGTEVPPGTVQGVTVLGWQDQLVEIEAVAAVDEA